MRALVAPAAFWPQEIRVCTDFRTVEINSIIAFGSGAYSDFPVSWH